MANVYDVAKYILDAYGAMSAMKLQKLIFYCQAMSMVWDDVPIFDDDFQAWVKGPVCKKLYDTHKGKFMLSDSRFLDEYGADTSRLSKENIDTIKAVVDSLIELTPYQLSQMTHSEQPWLDARSGMQQMEYGDMIIPKETMENYYALHW